jgi:hypothetical protein
MIQTLNKAYYTVTQYKGSDIVLPSTHETMYNLRDIMTSNSHSISEWIKVCKENCKRFTKAATTEKVNKQIVSEIVFKKKRRTNYIANDKIAYLNKINHPNYNPFSPLFEEQVKGKRKSAIMDDETARQRFFKAMNGDYNDTTISTTTTTNKDIPIEQTEPPLPMDTKDPITQETTTVTPATMHTISDTTLTTKHVQLT